MKEFAKKLKNLRIKNKESQKDLADFLNISFQSVSKWEQGIHYPDIVLLQELAKHYNVSLDYLMGIGIKQIKETYKTNVNTEGNGIITWTDFDYNGTLAPESLINPGRHVPANRFQPNHPGPKDTIIMVIDSKNEICFLGDHINASRPSCGPHGFIYTKADGVARKNPCFIIESDYDDSYNNSKKYEFVIPIGGFLVIMPHKSLDTRRILNTILTPRTRLINNSIFPNLGNSDWHLFDLLLHDELNNCHVYLENDMLIIEKQEEDEPILDVNSDASDNAIFELLKTKIEKLERQIDDLQDQIDDLEMEIESLK